MRRIFIISVLFFFVFAVSSYGGEGAPVGLKGISLGMKEKHLLNSWGYPNKREHKNRMDVWYYSNENTEHPTDGIIVYLEKGKVKSWEIVDNIFEEMLIWGAEAGDSP